jgi:uncharacterized protein (TIGR02598 family)
MASVVQKTGRFAIKKGQTIDQAGFSLLEVVIATGLCTYALIIIASLLPVGMGVIQVASKQTVETEIFNELWSEFNTTPFASLSGSNQPLFNSTTASNPFWFDLNGGQLTSNANAIYFVRCTPVNSTTTVPVVDGTGVSAGLNLAEIQIGFHVDPASVLPGKTDPRVSTRTFLLVKRDGN